MTFVRHKIFSDSSLRRLDNCWKFQQIFLEILSCLVKQKQLSVLKRKKGGKKGSTQPS